jgi:virginiamycin A acetyltransferase
MKSALRRLAQLFLKIFFPRLYFIEKNNAEVGHLVTNIARSTISSKAKIVGPAQVGNCNIGDYTYVGSNSVISLTTIGKFCSIGPNFFCGFGIHPTNGLSTSPAFYSKNGQCGISFSEENKVTENLPITIGNDVFIGMNVTVLDGVTIGDGAVIGAGAIVSKDIPAYAIAVGSPIKVIRYRFDEITVKKLLDIQWWNFNHEQLKDVEKHFFDLNAFMSKYHA